MNFFGDRQVRQIIQIEPRHYKDISSWFANDRKSRQRWEDIAMVLQVDQADVMAVTTAYPDSIKLQIEETFKKIQEKKNLTFNDLGGALVGESCREAAKKLNHNKTEYRKLHPTLLPSKSKINF